MHYISSVVLKIDTILRELKEVPTSKLDEVYEVVHSLVRKKKRKSATAKKILSFAGSFSDMSRKDFNGFVKQTKKLRKELFNRV